MAASHGMADLKMSFTATFHEIEPPLEQDSLWSASLVPPGSAVSATLSPCQASLLVIEKSVASYEAQKSPFMLAWSLKMTNCIV